MASEVVTTESQCWSLPRMPWLNRALHGGLMRGGSYLLSGAPGSNKTTLCIQMAIEVANLGRDVLLLLNEQREEEIVRMFGRIEGLDLRDLPDTLVDHTFLAPFSDPADLLRLLRKYCQAQVLIVDSLQGGAMSTVRPSGYRTYARFLDLARKLGKTVIAVAHLTKAGKVAGPRSLEHKVDACLFLTKAACFRYFYVTKNRFGPEVVDPVVLESTPIGLMLPLHQHARSTSVLGYSGEGDSLLEVQAMVSLPRYDSRPELNAPFLPAARIRQILGTISTIPRLDLTEALYVVNALVPEPRRYVPAMDLALAVALLSTYLHRGVRDGSLFFGGVDLHRNVRPVGMEALTALAYVLGNELQRPVKRVYLSSGSAGMLSELLPDDTGDSERVRPLIIGVRTLDELLSAVCARRSARSTPSSASSNASS